ncbi:Ff.00g102360.m01.CDS01 [Fusarium sp. VM40]|nr:Ff.00g102360.m01.CDS01 [Fusarium sp. VM40]
MITNGNVILIISRGELRIRVTSHFLCEISDVFNAMLNGNFAEGIRLRNQSESEPTSIPLPEDSGKAMAHALKTLYGADPSMLQLSPSEIKAVALIADKYNMTARFAMAGTAWMARIPAMAEDRWKMTVAAYWLGLQEPFRVMSQAYLEKINHADIFRLANETADVALGLKLGMALLLLHNALRESTIHREGGLCLRCFRISKNDPLGMQPGCPFPTSHRIGG